MIVDTSSSPVRAVIVTHALMSVPALVMNIFEPLTIQLPSRSSARRAGRAGVGACAGLGQAERGESPSRREPRQPLLLLLLGAEEVDRHRPERGVRGDGDRHGRVDARQLLDRDRVRERVRAGAAVLLRDRHAHQPELGQLRDQLVREASLAVELLGDRRDPRLRELPHGAADELLLLAELVVHAETRRELGDQPHAVARCRPARGGSRRGSARGSPGPPCRRAPTARRRRTRAGTPRRARASPDAGSSCSSCRRTPSPHSDGSAGGAGTARRGRRCARRPRRSGRATRRRSRRRRRRGRRARSPSRRSAWRGRARGSRLRAARTRARRRGRAGPRRPC